jgi:hypothetical protein
MLNFEGSSAAWVAANLHKPDLIAWYGTGSAGIPATASERALFPGIQSVIVDQGGTGSPLETAEVRDVENGAWMLSAAVRRTGWNVARPTIYCARNTLVPLVNAGWTGDVWLAWPGYTSPEPPTGYPFKIVAVQDVFAPLYESSTVYDDTWPTPPSKEPEMIPMEVLPNDSVGAPFKPGTFTHVAIYAPTATAAEPVGVGVTRHSVVHGDTYHNEAIHDSSPLVLAMPYADVDAVLIHSMSATASVFVTLY